LKRKPDPEKLRGGYYTPQPIAQYLANWAIRSSDDNILEPSCGNGNILLEASLRLKSLGKGGSVTGVELFSDEAIKARSRISPHLSKSRCSIVTSDFFEFAEADIQKGNLYDVVIGNPPFVRYQDFPEEQRQQAFGLMRHLGLNPSRMANAWLPFLAICCGLLKDQGRLAMVIPAELFQVGYAAEVRKFLSEFFFQINIVTFKKLVFQDIQQEVVLILADRAKTRTRGIRVHEVDDATMLGDIDLVRLSKSPIKPVDHASEKWTKYFLDKSEIMLLREMRERADIPLLHNFIDIDVGVVTGANDYFLLDIEERKARGLEDCTIPVVGRSAALAGTLFTEENFNEWANSGKKAHLFRPSLPLSTAAKKYIKFGEQEGVSEGYKCRIRREWYAVPSLWSSDFFFLRQADSAPRLVANSTSAICTDTLHRGRLTGAAPKELLASAFQNSLTFAASEVTGRSYGGGVMTFEPSEVEKLPLPILGAENLDVAYVDQLVRARDTQAVLKYVDQCVLIEGLGVSQSDVERLQKIWTKLRDRRRGRKK